ncbi:MAG: signal recognition particle receptor subunit alpha, partial [Pseudomonadota bacterium]
MSFLSKLRSRLTRSSSKLQDGLDAMMEEGEAEPATPASPPAAAPATPEPAPRPPSEAPTPAAERENGSSGGAEVPAAGRDEGPSEPSGGDAPARPGFLSRVFGAGEGTSAQTPAAPAEPEWRRPLDDAFLEDLEDLLIQSDMGVATASRVAANLAEGRFGRRVGAREVKALLATEVAAILDPVARPLPLKPLRPQVVLVVGVNGSGKTTTIGKLSAQLKAAGKSVIIAAGDTFRAAAVEQLQVWGERAGVPVLTAPEGADPASLAFEALQKAQA